MSEPQSTGPTAEQRATGIQTGISLLCKRLAAPFPADVIKAKPQAVKGNKALAAFYLDPRAVADRLDEVLGVDGWQDAYQVLADGSVMCKLQIRSGGDWITKTDVGSQSDQPDGGDRMKAAFSDAFKRAAVKLGVGRYLYRIPPQWFDYDPQKKAFVSRPKPPAAFLPSGSDNARDSRPAASKAAPAANTSHVRGSDRIPGDGYKRPVLAGIERLFPDEAESLSALIKRANVDADSFLTHYDIPEVVDLPAELYREAVTRLNEKLKKSPAAA